MEREGKEYGDQEAFLTSAYRKKLEERKRMEEELREEARRDGEHTTTQEHTCLQVIVCLLTSQKLTTSPSKRISVDSTDTSYISKMAPLSLLLMRRPNLPFLWRVGEDDQVNPKRERREESRWKNKKLLQWRILRELTIKNLLHRRTQPLNHSPVPRPGSLLRFKVLLLNNRR